MRRVHILSLLFCAAGTLLAGPITPGIFNGHWSITNAESEAVTTGPLSVVIPHTGRPIVYFWEPVATPDGISYIEHFKLALTPTRRSLVWNVPRLARLRGTHEGELPDTASISGSLRFRELGAGAFSAERFTCSLSNYSALIPQQHLLLNQFQLGCPQTSSTNIITISNIWPRPPIIIIFTNRPPMPVATNFAERVEARRLELLSNRYPTLLTNRYQLVTNSWVLAGTNGAGQLIRAWVPTNYLNGDGTILPAITPPPGYHSGATIITQPQSGP